MNNTGTGKMSHLEYKFSLQQTFIAHTHTQQKADEKSIPLSNFWMFMHHLLN